MEAPAPAPRGRSAPDDASCASKSQASIDLSELFNPSALTRLLRQLNDQIDGQRDQIVLLEEQSIANAAFREMWAQDRAEFRAALAVATEENNKKINEAIGAAAKSVSDLRKTYNEERAFRRICHFAAHRTEIMQREKWETWARACREMRLWDKRRAVLIRMGNMNEKRHQTFGMTRWKEQTARARDAATMHNGANALIDALYVKRAVRRSFRHWVECVLLEQISDAFGGVEIVTSAHHEQVLSVAEAAAKPYVGRAAAAAAAGNFGEAFKQAHLGTMQVVKVMSSEQDMARQRDREALEGECENIRKALATVSAAAEEKRALEAKKALDRGNERLDKQLATTRRQIDGKITERITEALAQVEANAAGHAERAEARAKAADQRVAAKLQAADDKAMAAAHDVESLVHGCEAQVDAVDAKVLEVNDYVAYVERSLRTVYEDLRKHNLWETMRRRDADDAGQVFVRAALGLTVQAATRRDNDENLAFMAEVRAAEDSLARLMGQSAKQMSRAQTLVSEAKRNLAVEQQIRGVYEDAAPSSPGSVPRNVHHHHHHPAQKHFHKAPSVQWYDSETRAYRSRNHGPEDRDDPHCEPPPRIAVDSPPPGGYRGAEATESPDVLAAGWAPAAEGFASPSPQAPRVVVTSTAPTPQPQTSAPVAEAAPARMRARRRGMMEGLETGRVKGSVWDTVETNHKMVIARLDDLRDTTDMLREKSAATLGGPPPRPDPRAVAVDVVGPYEELVFQKKRVVKPPTEFADAAAEAARALASHAAAVANLEEIARVARGGARDATAPADVVFDAATGRSVNQAGGTLNGGPDEVARRRKELVDEFVAELVDGCVKLRPSAGALRLEGRVRFVKRFQDAAEAALSIFDQVIADAPTLLGRSKALPSCVACNRPLPTKARRPAPPKRDDRPAPEPPAGVEKLLASKGPDMPRPLTAPPGSKREEERKPVMSASERALKILHAHLPQTQTYGAADVDANSTNDQSSYSRNSGPQYYDDAVRTYDHRVGDNTAAFLEQRALHDAEQARRASSKQARAQAKLDAGALDPANAPAYQRGFRATKRLPGKAQRPQSAPRSGRALP